MPIKVGDFVTYRSQPNALGVTGCKVLQLGETAEVEPAAKLDMDQFWFNNALVAHLEPEDDEHRADERRKMRTA